MGARAEKLKRMDDCDGDRKEMERRAQLLTPAQMAQQLARSGSSERIRGYLSEPFDAEQFEVGVANARAAMKRSRLRVVSDDAE